MRATFPQGRGLTTGWGPVAGGLHVLAVARVVRVVRVARVVRVVRVARVLRTDGRRT